MKQSTRRGFILLITFLIFTFTGFYFDSYKVGGPKILLPLGFTFDGFLFTLSGFVILIDTFFYYKKGNIIKREHYLIDKPFAVSFILLFVGSVFLFSSINQLITRNY